MTWLRQIGTKCNGLVALIGVAIVAVPVPYIFLGSAATHPIAGFDGLFIVDDNAF